MWFLNFQPRFSLRGLFALVTFCAIATWYWYQRPYSVEAKVESLWGVCHVGRRPTDPPPVKNYREVRYFRRVRGQNPVMHGPYRGHDQLGHLLRSGYYVNGQEHGEFIDYFTDGARTTWKMVRGKREGETRSVDGNGTVRALAYYVNGELQGTGRSWDAVGNLVGEENYEAGIQHGKSFHHDEMGRYVLTGQFEHGIPAGKWTCSLHRSDIHDIRAQWEDGQAVGRWEWRASNGDVKFAVQLSNGKVTHVEPSDFSVRVAEELIQYALRDPRMVPYSLSPSHVLELAEPKLEDLVKEVCYEVRVAPDSMNLELPGLDGSALITKNQENCASALAMYEILKARGLGFDVRYGHFHVEPLEHIQNWRDPTSVTCISPPVRSMLAEEWDRLTTIDVVEMPFRDVIQYFADMHLLHFDTSSMRETAIGGNDQTTLDTPVTLTGQGLVLRHALGVLLQKVNCRASLRGETIVIEPN